MDVSPIEKAAILLMSLEPEQASNIMKHLGPKEVQKLGLAMSTVKNVEKDRVNSVIHSFIDDAKKLTSLGVDSDQYIRTVLVDALGQEKASNVIDKILLGANTKGLDTLKWMEPKTVADIIRNEHPQIQNIVLSHLEPDQAADVLMLFPERTRLDLIMRISTQETIQPSALQELNSIMEKQLSGAPAVASRVIGGIKSASEILTFLDSGVEGEILEGIKEKDEDLAQEIQELMFIFDNLLDVDDRGIQALLREVTSDILILALKGADDEIKEKIFTNMSKRAAELLKDDLEAKGPVRISEVEAAQKEILTVAKRMADSGEISLGGKGGEEMV